MLHPKISVLMSVFNGSCHFRTAVESILNQTFEDFELIIIDDGSREPVSNIIQDFGDDRITFITQENIGLTRSLNRGLKLCRAEYVARMDADDICLPDRFKAQFEIISSSNALDLVGTFFEIIDEYGHVIQKKKLIKNPIYRLWRLLFHNNYGHGTIMFRKSTVIAAGMYDTKFVFAQDFDLWSRISQKNNTYMLPEYLYQYRVNAQGEQASVKNYENQLRAAIWISDRNLRSCNPELGPQDLIDLRSLYWEFQLTEVSNRAPVLALKTLNTFFGRYDLDYGERDYLTKRVELDLLIRVKSFFKI